LLSQPVIAESSQGPSTQPKEKVLKTPRSSKKRRNESTVDDEVAQALVEALRGSNSSDMTPTSLAVLQLEKKLDQPNLQRQKLAFIRKINDIVMETEEALLNE